MLLAIDIGNTNIVLGLFEGEKLSHKFRLETNIQKSAEDYAIDIIELFLNDKIDCLKISTVSIVSVVPNFTNVIETAVKKFYNGNILVVGRDIKLKIEVTLKNKQEVGFDRLINAIAGHEKFGNNLIIIDFGTATTFDVVGEHGEYLGGVIAPGVNLSIKALHDMTAQLPKIQLKPQKNVIGKSTFEAINSGIYFGYISLVEGLVAKIKAEQNCEMKVIITGGLSTLFGEALTMPNLVQPDLTLEGLRLATIKK
ncbi:MAG: transcriptional activator, Baf family [Rickettsiaceae bacterium]|jgi:type III pantothenate kinase|nr:transcriptional activator, Baf family [Rickettsiaceae bacterium]